MRNPLCLLSLLAALGCGPAWSLTVRATSPRVGLAFTEDEPVDVRVAVGGAPGPVTVDYAVAETDGPWRAQGTLTPAAAEAPLPLKLPGRGLYRLTLTARSGGQSATAATNVAVLFPPPPVDSHSPWGIFYIPLGDDGFPGSDAPTELARSLRRLGASWARYNFWAHTYGQVTLTPGDPPQATADLARARAELSALRSAGLNVMGEIAQVPRPLSSRPNDTTTTGDAGPLWCRVKPADYRVWDPFVEHLAAEFRDTIEVWELLNEADIPGGYWAGTAAEFTEFVTHTSQALRRGNPAARIAAAGFVARSSATPGGGCGPFAEQVLASAAAQLNLLTVHYTSSNPGILGDWRALLQRTGGAKPIWNTEERPPVPVGWLSSSDGPFFKFLHVRFTDAYDSYGPMAERNLTLLPDGVAFSVGARLLGARRFAGRAEVSVGGLAAYRFGEGDDEVTVIVPDVQAVGGKAVRLFGEPTSLTLALRPGAAPAVTLPLGRTLPLAVTNGQAEVPAARTLFVTGCRQVAVVDSHAGTARGVVAEAEDGRHSAGWGPCDHPGFSGGRSLDIWAGADPPDAAGYWVELTLNVPKAGRYDVCFSGNNLVRLSGVRTLSPFVWRFGDGPEQPVPDKVKVVSDVPGAVEGLSLLGTVELTEGRHTFRLRLTGRRQAPDHNYALWFDAIGLRPVE